MKKYDGKILFIRHKTNLRAKTIYSDPKTIKLMSKTSGVIKVEEKAIETEGADWQSQLAPNTAKRHYRHPKMLKMTCVM